MSPKKCGYVKNHMSNIDTFVLRHTLLQCKFQLANFSGYALKDVAVYWTMKTNPEVYARLGRAWDGDDKSYCHVWTA